MAKVAVLKGKNATFSMCLTILTESFGKQTGASTLEKKVRVTEMMVKVTEVISILIEVTDTGVDEGQGHIVGTDIIMTEGPPQGQNILDVDTQDLGQGQMTENLNIENQGIPDQGHDHIQEVILAQGRDQKKGNIKSQETGHVHGHDHTDILGQG